MKSKKELLRESRLYLILDASVLKAGDLLKAAKKALHAGVKIFQLRDKSSGDGELIVLGKKLKDIITPEAVFIINDRVDVALKLDADGVHIGQDDLSLAKARRMMGRERIIGVSCQTIEQAVKAQQARADYIGFGSVYKTKTKPARDPMDLGLLKRVCSLIDIPVFAIGGITAENVAPLIDLGVERIAVTRAILKASDVGAALEEFKAKLRGKHLVRE